MLGLESFRVPSDDQHLVRKHFINCFNEVFALDLIFDDPLAVLHDVNVVHLVIENGSKRDAQ